MTRVFIKIIIKYFPQKEKCLSCKTSCKKIYSIACVVNKSSEQPVHLYNPKLCILYSEKDPIPREYSVLYLHERSSLNHRG